MLQLDQLRADLGGVQLCADWSVPVGARVAVVGPSGAGKSSLLLAISGFLPQAAVGRILWQGRDIAPLRPEERPVSMLFQDQNLFAHMTLLQNVVLGLTAGKRPSAAQLQAAEGALAQMGLAGLGARKPHQVSGGQMARAALARVLLQNRPLILLDEPFAALDAPLRGQIRALLADLATQTKATVLLVSHDMGDVQNFASHVIELRHGTAFPPVLAADYLAKTH
jgi:thiamine transport system ATP-binding protein